VEEGSLYPALYRMERQGWIEAEWGVSELGRKARVYRLTPKGRRQLAAETERFALFVAAVSPILLPA
jgi:PadR family transcriptional regulator